MIYRGRIKDGMVVFDDAIPIPEGTTVDVHLAAEQEPSIEPPKTLYERLQDVIGSVDGMPPDGSRNHDHYLYGTPKQE